MEVMRMVTILILCVVLGLAGCALVSLLAFGIFTVVWDCAEPLFITCLRELQ